MKKIGIILVLLFFTLTVFAQAGRGIITGNNFYSVRYLLTNRMTADTIFIRDLPWPPIDHRRILPTYDDSLTVFVDTWMGGGKIFSTEDSLRYRNASGEVFTLGRRYKGTGGTGESYVPKVFEKVVSHDGENNIPVSFPLDSVTVVTYNGSAIPRSRWSGMGTSMITLALETRLYDVIIIQH